ncbi:NADPH:quinone reductase [Brevibacterium sp. Mu109]|uniref:zinc-dependent alcohol dehydrogenase family protein n=1 Tax=Brevibacterium sp. Mu109 TaxID=1255669 RepID=UPI000C4D2945|nr:zinc-dependent alcohol dehydrogenase family protein [Brevibacterium sp. Mu109]SMX92924.1 NADPH:quinone reductase [Brevibacterium sp. Mu109]
MVQVMSVVAERPGKLNDVLSIRSAQIPVSLADSEVAVRMLASTINPSDAVTVSGAYGSRTEFPFVPGFEGIGVIEQAGPGVPGGMIGRRVLPIGSAGNWQQIKRTDYTWCIPVPDDLDDTVACFAYINPLTAHLMVDRHSSDTVRSVAVTAATTTIATHLAELLNLHGIYPVGVIRGTPGSLSERPEQCSSVIDTSESGWEQLLHGASGRSGFDVVFDCVGGSQGAALMDALVPGGVLVHYGLLSGEPLPPVCFTQGEGKRVEMFRLRDIIHAHPRERLAELFDPVFTHLRAGRLRTPVARRVSLRELPEFLREEHGRAVGKTLITYPG